MLYAGDARWWSAYGAEVDRSSFAGELWACDPKIQFANYIEAVDEPGLSTKPGRVHLGGNSGYQAVNLAYLFGASKIILVGYDMQVGPNGEKHHHPDHSGELPNPHPVTLKEWARRFIQLGADLRAQGVLVINATRQTALQCFEQLPLEIALMMPRAKTASVKVRKDLLPKEYAAFEKGLTAAGYRLTESDADVTVSWGKGDGIVAENGYLDGQEGPYVALARGGHNGAGKPERGSAERWARLGVDLKPWRKDGDHVLVCPSRGLSVSAQPQPEGWTEQTVAELKKLTDRPIRVRPHPGNWKVKKPKVSLEDDLRGAWACVTWASAAGVKALVEGIPVIYRAPHWICAEAASKDLAAIEAPLMPDRLPVFERLAASQWTLDEIASGEAFRSLLGELTVLCVLRSGGDYDAEYVRKLRDGVAKHLSIPHRFVCLSDVPVPCERIALKHDWPGWWCKLEMFRPDVITGPTLYLDLDTIIVDSLDRVAEIPYDFAMLNIREKDVKVGNSGAMWFRKAFPHVYERFAEKPQYWMDYHLKHAKDRYMGDQAFISDCFQDVPKLHHALPGFFRSYKYDKCQEQIPHGCAVVCFGGYPRPRQAGGWVRQAWV